MAKILVDDDIDWEAYEAETEAKSCVKPGKVYVEGIVERVKNPIGKKKYYLPWSKTEDLFDFRAGEVTCWGGANGSGKSLVTGMVGLSLASQGQKVAVASFEMKPEKTLERMARQWTHYNPYGYYVRTDEKQRNVMIDLLEQFGDWSDNKLWMYDQQGTVKWERVCGVIRYCADKLGVQQFFVDNLMKCVAGEDDFNGQKMFVDSLTAIARDTGMHIHLIHHIRKPPDEAKLPNKYDFKGSGSITDQVDNVIVVWRNKVKETALDNGKQVDRLDPDAVLKIDKQRNGEGTEGAIRLYYDKESQQFKDSPDGALLEFY